MRWLDWIFLAGYLPSLSINYVAMSKDMGKRLPQLYYIKMKRSGFYCNRSRHGNVTTPLSFLFILVFLCTKSFFLRNRLREFVPAIIASVMAKFKQILWERFRDILKRSFKHHKNSEIAYYPHVIWSMLTNFTFFKKPLDKFVYKFDNPEINCQ